MTSIVSPLIPSISIIVPVLNAREHIAKCLTSIVVQSKWLHELIIMDGGSTDGTIEEAATYAASNSKIRLFSQADSGQSDAMNNGFALSTGTVIGFVNADDWLWEGALEQVCRAFSDERVDILLGAITIFADNCHRYNRPSPEMLSLLEFYSFEWPLNPVGYFCSRRLHDAVGLYPVDNHLCMDYWFLLRAFAMARSIRSVDVILGTYHKHGNNKSQLPIEVVFEKLQDVRDLFLSEYAELIPRKTILALRLRELCKFLIIQVRPVLRYSCSLANRLCSLVTRLIKLSSLS